MSPIFSVALEAKDTLGSKETTKMDRLFNITLLVSWNYTYVFGGSSLCILIKSPKTKKVFFLLCLRTSLDIFLLMFQEHLVYDESYLRLISVQFFPKRKNPRE